MKCVINIGFKDTSKSITQILSSKYTRRGDIHIYLGRFQCLIEPREPPYGEIAKRNQDRYAVCIKQNSFVKTHYDVIGGKNTYCAGLLLSRIGLCALKAQYTCIRFENAIA